MLTVDDLINQYGSSNEVIQKHFNQIILISKHHDSDKELKKIAIINFTDYIMYSTTSIDQQILMEILQVINFAIEFCLDEPKINEDEEILDFKIQLKENIFEFFSVCFTKEEVHLSNEFKSLISPICKLIHNTLSTKTDYSVKLYVFNLLAEICYLYSKIS